MFIAMNRFRIKKGEGEAFESIWAKRRSRLPEVPGFIAFHLLRGPEKEDHTLYASHTTWESPERFEAWTRSDAFRQAHEGSGAKMDIYLGPPVFEGFEAVQAIDASS